MASEEKRVLTGVLAFHSETGTEGGYWAFQDAQFIKENVPRGWCKKCGVWLRAQSNVTKTPDCEEGLHEEYIGDEWSYDGLHVLRSGDHLKIFDHEDPVRVVWEGDIKLHHFPLFTEHASGLWIHDDQVGMDRKVWAQWFFDQLPAQLVLKK